MKKVLLSLSFLFFSFFTSQVSFASFDCSFSQEQLKTMTKQQFEQLPQERKVELSILFHAAKTENDAAVLVNLLPRTARMALHGFAENVPTVFQFCSWEDRKSARGKVLQITLKAIAMGFVKEVPVQFGKQLVGVNF